MIYYYDTINYLNNTDIFVFVVETQFGAGPLRATTESIVPNFDDVPWANIRGYRAGPVGVSASEELRRNDKARVGKKLMFARRFRVPRKVTLETTWCGSLGVWKDIEKRRSE
ncbi:hypothetical protein PV325_007869 [Microctonus aethiopoides]|nr:hypothetical protein PV325_007869 [Microctonus aethiopoides]KAK0095359.1 hypothetical protein PV326_008577 [Microctonus aethiopoides]